MKYFIAVDGKQKGPLTIQQVIAMKPSGDALVWHEGMEEWKPVSQLKEFASLKDNANIKPRKPAVEAGAASAPKYKNPWAAIVSLCFSPMAILFIIATIIGTGDQYDYNLDNYYLSSSGYKASWLECLNWPAFTLSLICTIITDTFSFIYILGGRTRKTLKVAALLLSIIFTLFIIIFPLL